MVGVLLRGAGVAANETGQNTVRACFLPDGDGHGWLSPIVRSAPAARVLVRKGCGLYLPRWRHGWRLARALQSTPCGLGASDCRADFLKSPICECLIHILGFFAALAWFLLLWGVCCLADGFFLFASGVGLSLFACWFIGVGPVPWSGSFALLAASLAVCFGRGPFLDLILVYWRCPCAGRHLCTKTLVIRRQDPPSHRTLW
jgi:hypothetical protein